MHPGRWIGALAICGLVTVGQAQDVSHNGEYSGRRSAALSRMGAHAVAVFRSAKSAPRTASSDWPFRQSNNLLYLTGCDEERTTLVLVSHPIFVHNASTREVLFVPSRNPASELWNGVRMGPAEAAARFSITTLPADSLDAVLGDVLKTADTVYYDWSTDMIREALPLKPKFIARDQEKDLKTAFPSIVKVASTGALVDGLRLIKSPWELAQMQKAIDVSCAGHRAAMHAAHAGVYEYELAAAFDREIEAGGAEGLAYPDIVGSGPNACTLHYETNRRKTEPHELVLMDCGAEYHGYAADVTRTFPIDGAFTPEQRTIYELVLRAQDAAIREVKPGAEFKAPHKRAFAIISEGLARLGIAPNPAVRFSDPATVSLDSVVATDTIIRRYFPHGTSHTLGMDVHDTHAGDRLVADMVITVEPGIYIPAGSACDPKWWNIGVRIEDDVLVTDTGSRVLSACAPKTIAELESR